MKSVSKKYLVLSALFSIILLLGCLDVNAQSNEFTYQGRLLDNSLPPTASYDFQFSLWDTLADGTQVGTTQTVTGVAVAGGIFTVKLDFGTTAFADGSARFLEVEVKPAAGGSFTTLAPRQPVTSSPHSIRSRSASAADSLSANCVNCVTSGQIESIDGAQITGTLPVITVPTGSDNYIQNASIASKGRPAGAQQAASLNIAGNATVGNIDVNGPFSLAAIGAPAAAPAGQGRIYFDSATNKVKVSENGSAFVDLVGATGVSGSGTVNSVPLFTAGTTLSSSLISQTGSTTINLPAFVSLAATASGNNIAFGSPNSGTGMTISGPTTRADVRLDGTSMSLRVGPAGVGPPGNGIGIDATTVTLPAFVSLAATASGNNIAFGSPNSGTGMTISGPTTRADVRLDGNAMNLMAGPAGVGPPGSGISINRSGNVGIGTISPGTALHVVGTTRSSIVEITGGSDLAEKFSFSEPVTPGMVVAIDAKNAGKLKLARGAYNRQAAGIISGANNLSAGMTLPDVKNSTDGIPVALSGRVWVYCDATRRAIRPGDLLTTSATPGHAMTVLNHSRAQGSIIGKAMTSLKAGRGLVLVLVTLQ